MCCVAQEEAYWKNPQTALKQDVSSLKSRPFSISKRLQHPIAGLCAFGSEHHCDLWLHVLVLPFSI